MSKSKKMSIFLVIWVAALSLGLATVIMGQVAKVINSPIASAWMLGFVAATMLSYFAIGVTILYAFIPKSESVPKDIGKKAKIAEKIEDVENQEPYIIDSNDLGQSNENDVLPEEDKVPIEVVLEQRIQQVTQETIKEEETPTPIHYCPKCQSTNSRKDGKSGGKQRYFCKNCGRRYMEA